MKLDIYGNPVYSSSGLGNYDFLGNQRAKIQQDMSTAIRENTVGGKVPEYLKKDTAPKPGSTPGLGDYLGMGVDIANIGLAGMNAYTGWESLGLAKDQFGFEKAAANRNIANQGKQINNAYENASNVGLALGGGAMTSEQVAAEKAALQNRYVDTSAIG